MLVVLNDLLLQKRRGAPSHPSYVHWYGVIRLMQDTRIRSEKNNALYVIITFRKIFLLRDRISRRETITF